MSTLLYALLLSSLYISRTLTASPQKPAAEQCLGKMCQQNRVGGVSRVGHINGEPWEEESRTSQGSLPDINVAFVSTLLLPRCKRCEPEWLSTRTRLQIRLATLIREYSAQNSPLAIGYQQCIIYEASFCIRSLVKLCKVSQGWVRIRCPIGPTDSPEWLTLDHCSSFAFSHCHKSFSHRCPQLCFRRRIYRICDPSAIRRTDPARPLRSDLPTYTCPPALGGREQSGSVILGLD